MNRRNQALARAHGYAMAAMLVALAVMAVLLTVAMPAWRQMVRREKEDELIFRGQQYVRAIGLFQRRYAATFPPSLDTLVEQRFLRRKYKDPMVEDGQFQVLFQGTQMAVPGQGRPGTTAGGTTPLAPGGQQTQPPGSGGRGATGDTSFRPGSSFGSFGSPNTSGTLGPRGGVIGVASKSTETSIRLYNGRNHYNEWQFIYAPTLVPGRGQQRPGMPGMGGRGGTGQGPGGLGPGGPGGMRGRGGFGRPGRGDIPQTPGGRGPGRP